MKIKTATIKKYERLIAGVGGHDWDFLSPWCCICQTCHTVTTVNAIQKGTVRACDRRPDRAL